MEFLASFVDLFIHLDEHLSQVIADYGVWTYLILFLIVFCETGLVVTPFLPGDSLLFAAGIFAAKGSLDPSLLMILLSIAAIGGDAVNYAIGNALGPKVLRANSRFLKKEYLDRTHYFYERYGGKTIIIARFVPIVRTFAPFLAGVGTMSYGRFASFNVLGGLLWVALFVFGGYYFGSMEIVRERFEIVVLAIIGLSVLPVAWEWWRSRRTPRPIQAEG